MFFGKNKKSDKDNDRIKVNTSTITTFIGVDSVFEGKVTTKASIRIDGTVIGDIRTEGVVVLTKSGKVVGTIEAENIIVAGVIEGNMSIRDKVNVEPTGEIYGDIVTSKFVIDEESIFQGNCIMNRDGSYIPVTPYVKDEKNEEEKEKDKEPEVKETKKDKKNRKNKAKNDNKSESEVKDKEEEDAKEQTDEKLDDDSKADPEKEESDDAEAEDKSEDSDEDESEADDAEELDDEIEISDIDELKSTDEDEYIDSKQVPNPKKKNATISKSLSVEIEDN